MQDKQTAGGKSLLRTGVVGVGSLGRHHVRNYAVLASEGQSELAAVCDSDPEKESVAAGFGAPFVTDWRDLIGKVDAVSIVTPTETHCEIACEFLRNGVNCLVEKPIARSLEEADRIIDEAERTGAVVMTGHLERFNPAMMALRPRVTKPLYFEIHRVSPFPNRSLDVDVVLDVMIHDLDAVRWLVGENVPLENVNAVGIPIISDKVDAANARIEFENGTVANITASRVGTGKVRKTRFYQTDAYVVLDYVARSVSITSMNPEAAHPLGGISIDKLEVQEVEPLRAELAAFLESVRGGTPPPVTAQDGRRALELAIKVLESIEEHRAKIAI